MSGSYIMERDFTRVILITLVLLIFSQCSNETSDFEKIKTRSSILDCIEFLHNYPESKYIAEVEMLADSLNELEYQIIEATIADIEKFREEASLLLIEHGDKENFPYELQILACQSSLKWINLPFDSYRLLLFHPDKEYSDETVEKLFPYREFIQIRIEALEYMRGIVTGFDIYGETPELAEYHINLILDNAIKAINQLKQLIINEQLSNKISNFSDHRNRIYYSKHLFTEHHGCFKACRR